MGENTKIVRDFIDAWGRVDLEAIMSLVTDDCFYHNIPMEPMEGAAAIRVFIQGFLGMSQEIEWEVHHIAESSDGVVLTERTDKFKIGENWIAIRVMGTFELRDGRISAWRDYFDLGEFQSQMGGGS